MPETPIDTSDEAIRKRLFELMPKFPSKDACKLHLRAEGFPPDAVERIVNEIFAIRKQVAQRRIIDEHSMVGVLVSILDGEQELPVEAEKLEATARAYRIRLDRDYANFMLQLRIFGWVMVGVIAITVWSPTTMLVLALAPLRRIWVAVAVYGAILGAIGNIISTYHRLKQNQRRSKALSALIESQNWSST